jgi:hypothetical protein
MKTKKLGPIVEYFIRISVIKTTIDPLSNCISDSITSKVFSDIIYHTDDVVFDDVNENVWNAIHNRLIQFSNKN